MARKIARTKKRRATQRKQDNFLVIYKVSIFTALVVVIGAFLLTLFAPLIQDTVAILGAFTSR
jgi:cell division septal protein FtsQ